MDWVVIGASFIGLGKLLGAAHAVCRPGGLVLAMVKPQFERGKGRVGKGGVVRDEAERNEAIEAVVEQARSLGFELVNRADAAIAGPKGNRECFLHLGKRA